MKAKWDPDVAFLRWKKEKDLAVWKYAKSIMVEYLADLVRESTMEALDLKFPYSARFSQYSRELQDLMLSDPELARELWLQYGLPAEEFDLMMEYLRRGWEWEITPEQIAGVELLPSVCKLIPIVYTLPIQIQLSDVEKRLISIDTDLSPILSTSVEVEKVGP